MIERLLQLDPRFSLVTCLNGEQIRSSAASMLVAGLCAEADVVAFSAAAPGQVGENLHWPSYWARLFARNGYQAYDLLRDRIWWDQRVDWSYRQNTLVYTTPEVAAAHGWSQPSRSLDLAQPALLVEQLRSPLWATVCIPWRPSPSRLAAFDRVLAYWKQFGWPVVTADSDTKIFSLAQARNNAVEQATTDVVVIADADTLPLPLNILYAVSDPVGICWPFNRYRVISQEYLETPLECLDTVPYVSTWDGAGSLGVGGCLVATREEFWRLGGQPAEFIGWGWEDTAFTYVARTLSTIKRLRGSIYAFEHNTKAEAYTDAVADSPGWDRDINRNRHLMGPYANADDRPWLMRALLEHRHAAQCADM